MSSLIWQLPYSNRKSILQQQQKAIDAASEAAALRSEDLGEDEIEEN